MKSLAWHHCRGYLQDAIVFVQDMESLDFALSRGKLLSDSLYNEGRIMLLYWLELGRAVGLDSLIWPNCFFVSARVMELSSDISHNVLHLFI